MIHKATKNKPSLDLMPLECSYTDKSTTKKSEIISKPNVFLSCKHIHEDNGLMILATHRIYDKDSKETGSFCGKAN